jgi:hypothetical protein
MPEAVCYPVSHEPLPTWRGHPGGYELRYSVRGEPFYVWKKPVPRIRGRANRRVTFRTWRLSGRSNRGFITR